MPIDAKVGLRPHKMYYGGTTQHACKPAYHYWGAAGMDGPLDVPVAVLRSSGDIDRAWKLGINSINNSPVALSDISSELVFVVVTSDDRRLWKTVTAETLCKHNPNLRITITLDELLNERSARAWQDAAVLPNIAVVRAAHHPPPTTMFVPFRKVMVRATCDVCNLAAAAEYMSPADHLYTVLLCGNCDDPKLARQCARNGAGAWRFMWGMTAHYVDSKSN